MVYLNEKTSDIDKNVEGILALRTSAIGSPAKLGKALGIPNTTANYQLKGLQKKGLVKGYIPIVPASFFGIPYLIIITVNPEDFQKRKDANDTVNAHKEYLLEGIGHAPFCVYVRSEQGLLMVYCVTMTKGDIDEFVDDLRFKMKIARDGIEYVLLKEADGVPMYSKFSLGVGEQE